VPCEVDVDAVAEDSRDLRETVPRERARVFEARNASERGLDGNVTCFSTSTGESSGTTVLIWTWLFVMSGTASIGSFASENPPITAATSVNRTTNFRRSIES
jgi:hypothetical protein